MCTGIALDRCEIPDSLVDEYGLTTTSRGAESSPEVQVRYQDKKARLPVWLDGQLQILTWGNRDDKQSRLPRTGWARRESVEDGKWKWLRPEKVTIPASYGLEKGVWFAITEGMEGLVVLDEQKLPHVDMLTQPASHYYQTMTRHERMPILLGDQI